MLNTMKCAQSSNRNFFENFMQYSPLFHEDNSLNVVCFGSIFSKIKHTASEMKKFRPLRKHKNRDKGGSVAKRRGRNRCARNLNITRARESPFYFTHNCYINSKQCVLRNIHLYSLTWICECCLMKTLRC